MKKGNTTTSSIEYEKSLQKVLLEIESLKQSDLKEMTLQISFQAQEAKDIFLFKSKCIFFVLLESSLFMLQKWESKYSPLQNSCPSQ